ncbi:MAG TPA: hypothetical protein VLK58_20730, partial [Conexibacter sp.]|nr:hypothetical protein [Conexibacter sp.]
TAGVRYMLRVQVGNPRAGAHRGFAVGGFPGYRVELRAGGRLLAHEQDRVKPAEGLFVETGVAYSATADDRALGKPLEIRLVNRNARAGAEVDFDDVRLQVARASGGGASLGSGGVAGVVQSGGGSGGASSGGAGGAPTSAAPTGNGGAGAPPADVDPATEQLAGGGVRGGAAAPPQ